MSAITDMVWYHKLIRLSGLPALLLSGICSMAQTKLSGSVADGQHHPLQGITILLISSVDTLQKRLTISDTAGNFSFMHVGNGEYTIRATSIGFNPVGIPAFAVKGAALQTLPPIILAGNQRLLKEVTIQSQIPQVEMDKGRIVFNVQ